MDTSSTNQAPLYTHSTILIFNEELFNFWSDQMETLLRSQDLWDVVKDGWQPSKSTGNNQEPTYIKKELKRDVVAASIPGSLVQKHPKRPSRDWRMHSKNQER